jgi:DNA polymerase sigma
MAHTKRRMPYSLGSEKLEKLNPKDVKSKLSEDEERKLSTDMRELYDRLLPTPESEERREKLVQKLEKLFNDEWPGHNIRVHVFGSSGNLLCTDESDGQWPIRHETERFC